MRSRVPNRDARAGGPLKPGVGLSGVVRDRGICDDNGEETSMIRSVWKPVALTATSLFLFSIALSAQAPPSADTFVSSAYPTTNFGSVNSLTVGPGSTSYVQFNLATIPAGATVSKATLRLYVDLVVKPGKFDVFQVNNSWSERTLTYNTQPLPLGGSLTNGAGISITTASWNQFLLIDITSLVQTWVNSPDSNKGVALMLTTGSSGNFYFDAKESLLTGNGPELEIALTGTAGPQGLQGAQGPQGTTGAQGPKGDTGATGPQGLQGPQGPQGQTGPQGATGAQGPIGVEGAAGPQGPQGAAGQGFNFKSAFDNSSTYAAYDVVSFNGSSYVAKATINPGDPPPDVNPNWSSMAQQGAAGPAGATGSHGPTGSQGLQGPPGIDGPQGLMGLPGVQGPPGQVNEAEFAALVARVAVLESAGGVVPPPPPPPPSATTFAGRTDFTVGSGPISLAFDGTSIWVANEGGSVSKLLASDGSPQGTFLVQGSPTALISSAQTIWVSDFGDDSAVAPGNITRLTPLGQVLHLFNLQSEPNSLAFDGTDLYFVDASIDRLSKLDPTNGVVNTVTPVGSTPAGLLFDGTHFWVSNQGDNTVSVWPPLNQATTIPVGAGPGPLAFDGSNIWVANTFDGTVTKIRASDGAKLGTFAAGSSPSGIAFDGTNVWVTNIDANTVTEVRSSDGAGVATLFAGNGPAGIVFGGGHIWVANFGSNTVSKF